MALNDHGMVEIVDHLFKTYDEEKVLEEISSTHYKSVSKFKDSVLSFDSKTRLANDSYSASDLDYDFDELETSLAGVTIDKESHQIITAPRKRLISSNNLTEEKTYQYLPITFSLDDIRRYEPDPNDLEQTLVYTKGESKPQTVALAFSDFLSLYVGGSTGTKKIYRPGGQARIEAETAAALQALIDGNTISSKPTEDAGKGQYDTPFSHEQASKVGIDGYMLPYMADIPKEDYAQYGFEYAYGLDAEGNRVKTYKASEDWKFGDGNGELRVMFTGGNVPAVGEIVEVVRDHTAAQVLPKAEDYCMYGVGIDAGRGETIVEFPNSEAVQLGFNDYAIQEIGNWSDADQANYGFDYAHEIDANGKTLVNHPVSTLTFSFVNNTPRQITLTFPGSDMIGKSIRLPMKYNPNQAFPTVPPAK